MGELISEGLVLMGIGMGVVFLFLGLLIAIISVVSTAIQSFEAKHAGESGIMTDEELQMIFVEAVRRYRQEHPRTSADKGESVHHD